MSNRIVSVIGLGYVGLPVAVAFAKKFQTIGFDINERRLQELRDGYDRTGEVEEPKLKNPNLKFTSNAADLAQANFHIITVPTPIDDAHRPDITALRLATVSVGKTLKKGDVVVYESTVYPGLTEEECVPILERESKLRYNEDFKVGYSPERINPGDTVHTFEKIKKVVSGSDQAALEVVAEMYNSVVENGVYRASSLAVAEAAKVIENTQRDINVALINELALIFHRMGIDTQEVLDAAGTKWNFLKFTPGLVGGHCIGVDPYYLTHKAERLGFIPQVILAGRRINDDMGNFIASEAARLLALRGSVIKGACATVLGVTFKENCPDSRNSRVFDIVKGLRRFGMDVQMADPRAEQDEVSHEYNESLTEFSKLKKADIILVPVSHSEYRKLTAKDFANMSKSKPILMDIKSTYDKHDLTKGGCEVWRL